MKLKLNIKLMIIMNDIIIAHNDISRVCLRSQMCLPHLINFKIKKIKMYFDVFCIILGLLHIKKREFMRTIKLKKGMKRIVFLF